MTSTKDINIICHYPKTDISNKVSEIQSEVVIRYISNMNTTKENKERLIYELAANKQ